MPPTQNNPEIFKCDQHPVNISSKIQTLYEEGKFFDITLVAGPEGVRVRAHRLVLSTASDYFWALLQSDMKERYVDEVELKAIGGDTMKLIVDFIYKGCIELRSETIEAILLAADYLGIPSLITGCWNYMGKQLTVENCIGIALFAQQHNMTDLYNKALSFTCSHFEAVYKEREFLQMTSDQVIELLKSDDFSVPSEESIFRCVKAWVDHDRQNRVGLFSSVLSVVRFWLLTPKFITENVIPLCNEDDIQKLTIKWLQWHVSPNTRSALVPADDIKPRKARGRVILLSGASTYELKIQTFDRESNSWSCQELPVSWREITEFKACKFNNELFFANSSEDIFEGLDLETLNWKSDPKFRVSVRGMLSSKSYSLILIKDKVALLSAANDEVKMCDLPANYNFVFYKGTVAQELFYIITTNQKMVCFDPVKKDWTSKRYPDQNLREFGFVGVGKNLYVVGGLSNGRITSVVRRYCPLMNTWSEVAPLKIPRSHVACVTLNNRLIACGGNIATGECNLVEEYNPDTNEWITLAPLLHSSNLYDRNQL